MPLFTGMRERFIDGVRHSHFSGGPYTIFPGKPWTDRFAHVNGKTPFFSFLSQLLRRAFQGSGAQRWCYTGRFLGQQSAAMLEQCCNHSKQCRNNVTTLCCAKSRCCESPCLTSPWNVQYLPSYVISPLKIIPDKYFSFSFDGKEKWHFFLVEENFVHEHSCFLLCRLRGSGKVFQVRRWLKLKRNGFPFYVCWLFVFLHNSSL